MFYLCVLIAAFFIASCNGQFLSPAKPSASSEAELYCSLLHVQRGEHPVLEPVPFLGIHLAPEKLEESGYSCAENFFIKVPEVIRGTPAEEAGIKKDDIILSFGGTQTCNNQGNAVALFKKMIEQQKIGSVVNIEVLRDNQRLSLSVKLAAMPMRQNEEAIHPGIENCPGQISKLENNIHARNAHPLFNKIFDGLYHRSNAIHNFGWPYEKEYNSLQLKEITYIMRHPLSAGAVAKGMSRNITAPIHDYDWRMENILKTSAHFLDIEINNPDSSVEITFPELIRVMELTKNKVEQTLSNLTSEERALFRAKALKPWMDEQWNSILEISMKIDRKKLFDAFLPLMHFLTRDNLSVLRGDIAMRFGHNKKAILYEAMTPIGKVIVGGEGANVYKKDAALIIDLGGDDLYLNNAGGTREGMPAALVVDFSGNDRYVSKDNFSQGAGVLGGGFLLDLGGNDTFVSLDGSQGAGFWGIGILYHGDGNSVLNSRSFSQGTAQMGLGIAINGRGDSKYSCLYGGQGYGLFGGAGILIDKAGNDYYHLGGLESDFRDPLKATQSMGQGFGHGIRPANGINGIPGGIGILADEQGNDIYIADYFAQGSSYYYGLGILHDKSGNDQYISGRYSQGAGIHSTAGVLIDEKGDDSYYASFGVAQGLGHDFGIGFFEDAQGNDKYWGGTLVQGAATNKSIGIFIDMQGDDEYTFTTDGQGHASDDSGMGVMIKGISPGSYINSDLNDEVIKLGVNQ
ncbi:MAG: PDZ domain-containing protein [Nitrospiraceae bacterium]|nr:MAG: PDZ domain-containing protein [Nitrospiraceae bacterium]